MHAVLAIMEMFEAEEALSAAWATEEIAMNRNWDENHQTYCY
jgi:hypothetical protein